ncbi:MAG: type I-G CRISPR-associated protein Csb2 [Hyphomicrobiaceae bacterium]
MTADGSRRVWRWRVEPADPPLTAAIGVGEAVRAAVMAAGNRHGLERLPDAFYDSWPEGGHYHAYWLPEDTDRDGRIDRMLVFAESGIDDIMAAVLADAGGFALAGRRYDLVTANEEPLAAAGALGCAKEWEAATPFVTRLWRLTKTGKERRGFTPEAQLLREIRERRLPAPVDIAWRPAVALGGNWLLPGDFLLERNAYRPPGDALAGFPLLAFGEPVTGPLAFGFGAHFGLGLMVPAAF